VLEIRGNPLPDGGFVTSYADITSYKNAARELRSLADALEHRIAERTRDYRTLGLGYADIGGLLMLLGLP
uniref:PAS-domain containing protein n=1 Tax=Acinetobacter baumannii TaxID=470 RepID=UPI001C0841EE